MIVEWKNTCPSCGKVLDGTTFNYGTKWLCSKCAKDKTDVLHCERGSKVKAVKLDASRICDREKAHKFLTEGKVYEVESLEVGIWQSTIYLKGFCGERFNTVHFERCG